MPPVNWSPEEFRRHGHRTVDWIADYFANLENHPVLSRDRPGDVRSRLPSAPPEEPEPFDAILEDLERIILPGITHWQAPGFFAFYPANGSGPAILGDLVSAGLGVQGMLWATSPACTELETHVLDWLVELLALPACFRSDRGGGVIQDTASSATLCALLAARDRASGTGSGGLTAYTSEEAHSSVAKAVRIAGLGPDALRSIPVDGAYRLDPAVLARTIREDRDQGLRPCFVCATAGTTSSQAHDPVAAIGQICRAEDLWLHVDAAMSGTAALCPEFRWVNDGLDLADSYCFNPHKWMLTSFDCDCFYVRDRQPLLAALSILPEYLRNQASESGAVIDYRDWQIPLGRRFRALKLWFVLRSFGAEGLRRHVRSHVAWAQRLSERVVASDRYELAAPTALGLVCLCHRDGDARSESILDELNRSGDFYLSHTRLADRYVIRVAIGGTHTTEHHVDRLWERLEALG